MRLSILVRGTVQGVGFRPYVHRIAARHRLVGWVKNGRDGVRIEVEGGESDIASFVLALEQVPRPARVAALERKRIADSGCTSFRILESEDDARAAPVLPPDLGICEDCRSEIATEGERRWHYPFTNCTRCGPRYSITLELPYDRPSTTMRGFALCADCRLEYDDVRDRRHHAQPIACPKCGPKLELGDRAGEGALAEAARLVREGKILALKGLGGFQLIADATNAGAIDRLRARKQRPHKPFAVMFSDEEDLARHAIADASAIALLRSAEAPIALLPRQRDSTLSDGVSMESAFVGAMLPYTPLHALLLAAIDRPVVCTSGNRASEPICIGNDEARVRLAAIADAFLVHDRPIVRPVDDSVVRGRTILRRARGYAPLPVGTIDPHACVLGMGAHLKSTVTLGHRGTLVASQHIGDLDAWETRQLLATTIDDLCAFFDARPRAIACDLHPDYASTQLAEQLAGRFSAKLLRVQHHHAHVAACMAEYGLDGPVLGLAWDGVGLGADGSIWGGEALICDETEYTRFATLRSSPLPGGDRAARDPRRAALGLLFAHAPEDVEAHAERWFEGDARARLAILERGIHAPMASSVGRLFDAIGALLGFCEVQSFEGQIAMKLERIASEVGPQEGYPMPLVWRDGVRVAEVRPLVRGVLGDLRAGVDPPIIARRFHETLVDMGTRVAIESKLPRVVLCGGCFQNELLASGLRARLEARGLDVYAPRAIPANDGGISFGQAWLAAKISARDRSSRG